MSLSVLAALFFTLFALILGVPRAMNRRRPRPEDVLGDDLTALDPSLG